MKFADVALKYVKCTRDLCKSKLQTTQLLPIYFALLAYLWFFYFY